MPITWKVYYRMRLEDVYVRSPPRRHRGCHYLTNSPYMPLCSPSRLVSYVLVGISVAGMMILRPRYSICIYHPLYYAPAKAPYRVPPIPILFHSVDCPGRSYVFKMGRDPWYWLQRGIPTSYILVSPFPPAVDQPIDCARLEHPSLRINEVAQRAVVSALCVGLCREDEKTWKMQIHWKGGAFICAHIPVDN